MAHSITEHSSSPEYVCTCSKAFKTRDSAARHVSRVFEQAAKDLAWDKNLTWNSIMLKAKKDDGGGSAERGAEVVVTEYLMKLLWNEWE